NGALQRLFTATPFTEFDSAYAMHEPGVLWMRKDYKNNLKKGMSDLCAARVLELARTGITRSEQSISFIGGWNINEQGISFRRAVILCAAHKPQQLQATLDRLGLSTPRIRIILMTHTKQ